MLKSFFILIFSFTLVFANSDIDQGDLMFAKKNYLKAIEYYKKAYKQKDKKARIKLIMTYIKLGDNFKNIKDYQKAKSFYEKAKDLKSASAKRKIAKVYEIEGDLLYKIKKYSMAKELYTNSLNLGNINIKRKLKAVDKKLEHEKKLKNDTRKLVSNTSPKWTKSIGRLIVPTKLEFKTSKRYTTKQKKCSATLVNFKNYTKSKVVLTASHCLSKFDKNAGDMRFIIRTKQGKMIQRFAKVIKDSHYDPGKLKKISDYAILILDKHIPKKQVDPMYIDKQSYLKLKNSYEYTFGSLAGFSSDIGEYGAKLTFDPKCELNYYNRVYGKSECSGFRGASGGPVVLTASDDNKKFEHYFVGIVSHFRNHDFQKIFFAPHHIFYKDIKKAINRYNR